MAAGDEMAERTVPLLRRPWPVLPDHHPDPVVTTHASVRHGPGRVHLRAQRHQARRRYGRRRCDDALARPLDHAGAMPRALLMMTLANGGRRVPTYMHPDMFASRAVKANDGRLMPMEDIPSEHVLAANGADLIIARNEQSVLSNTVFISGEIPRVTSFEKGMPGQHRLDAAGEWTPDELLVDERFVAVHLANKGLFVFTAFARRPDQCSHARGGAVSRHPPLWRLGRLPPGWPDRGDHSGDRRRARGLRPPADRRGALHRLAGVGTTGPAVRGSRRPVGGRKALCAVGTRGRELSD